MESKLLKNSIICVLIILLGIFIIPIFRLNLNILNKEHKQINILIGKEFENDDILNIVKEVTNNREAEIEKVEVYEDMAAINIKEISDEELENLNTKINEKYEIQNTVDNFIITDIPAINYFDYIKQYIAPIIISCIIIAVYIVIYGYIKKKIN